MILYSILVILIIFMCLVIRLGYENILTLSYTVNYALSYPKIEVGMSDEKVKELIRNPPDKIDKLPDGEVHTWSTIYRPGWLTHLLGLDKNQKQSDLNVYFDSNHIVTSSDLSE